MFAKRICWLLAAVLALGMVATISGCKKSQHRENSTLKLTFRGTESDDLKADVVVVLYGTDNVTPEVIKVTGADGLADFGNIGRTTATYTWAYKYTVGRAEQKWLNTIVEGPVLSETIYIAELLGAETPTLVDVRITNIPDSVASLGLQVGFNDDRVSQVLDGRTWETTRQNFQIYDRNKNDDGKVTFLVQGFDNSGDPVKYGYLPGQTIIAGNTYTVELTRDPAPFTWTSTAPVDSVQINYRYRGSEYLVGIENYNRMRSAGSDTFKYSKQMLCDWGKVSAYSPQNTSAGGSTAREIRHAYNGGIPGELKFVIPDYDFESVAFDSGSKVWSWKLSGTTPRDTLFWAFEQGTSDYVTWNFWVAPDKTSFTVPALPTAPSNIDWFDWSATYYKYLAVEDDNASGFKDFIRRWADQVDPDYGTWRTGWYMFPAAAGATAEEESGKRRSIPSNR